MNISCLDSYYERYDHYLLRKAETESETKAERVLELEKERAIAYYDIEIGVGAREFLNKNAAAEGVWLWSFRSGELKFCSFDSLSPANLGLHKRGEMEERMGKYI